MLHLDELAEFLNQRLEHDRYTQLDDPKGIYHPSDRTIARLGLALEPWPGLATWVQQEHLDALFLHRPWTLETAQLPENIGIVSYHLAFDEHLTLGFNLELATKLEMEQLEVLGQKGDRPIGMIGDISAQNFAEFCDCLSRLFGGWEKAYAGEGRVSRVAVVGAMKEALVREASDRGAQVYITGQFRKSAIAAVQETAIAVVAVGHRRSEEWGLRTLAELISQQWTYLQVCLPPMSVVS